jgi:hypothetical protein
MAEAGPTENQELLDEANSARAWFHAKKTRPIWAKLLTSAQTVQTLEGEERVVAGNFLCRGEAGDIWPQTAAELEKKYSRTDDVPVDGWHKYQPRIDAQGVMATQVNHAFNVVATWGKLTGKSGDFLVKNFQDRDVPNPRDIWIVDQKLFGETYERVED